MNDRMKSNSGADHKSNGDAFLRLESLNKSFGHVNVIHDFSLNVCKGEFVSLLGPSGCGKTTILRMIAGFIPKDGGHILLNGQRIDDVPSHKRGTAMVFQNYALFPHMTVGENISFGLRMHKVAKPEIVRRVGETLDLVRLRHLIDRYPRELSGGQQQRVALARGIVINPKLLLLDEPLSNLDAKLRKELRTEFLEIHRLAGITTLFVTHDLEEAFSVSDRVAVINQGRLEQYGNPIEIFTHPRTPFVANFIGHSNVISGTLTTEDDDRRLAWNGHSVKIAVEGHPGQTVRVAIPAHLIRIGSESLVFDNCFRSCVRSIIYLGAQLHIEVAINDFTLSIECPAIAETLAFKTGDDVYVGWSREDFIELPIDEG
jgi:ABC-type Fe3+/spermidine/putrescine transport system ATPase subunit